VSRRGTWHRDLIAALDRFAVGHYVGVSDMATDPKRAEASFAPAHWRRLQALRRTYDPDGIFLRQFGAAEPVADSR
jgi:FAD/FMN-containing dehydrogenase